MDIVLAALNAKYIHDNLAVRILSRQVGQSCAVYESNINVPVQTHYHKLLEATAGRALLGFSVYIWNVGLVIRLSSMLKKARPGLVIVLGGPECSGEVSALLDASRADYAICGEGEIGFSALVDHLCGKRPAESVPGLWYRRGGEWRSNAPADTPIEGLPFAYGGEDLSGRIAYYESSRGCPFRCQFCMSAGTRLRLHPIERTLSELECIVAQGAKQVKLIDRTFNADPARAREIWRALIQSYGKNGINFHFEIAAHLLGEEDFALLATAPKGLFQFEIGVQSTHAPTLTQIGRTAPLSAIFSAVRRLLSMGNIHIHLDLIAGLPHESLPRFGESFNDVFALDADALQFGFLKLLPGSGLRRRARELGIEYDDFAPYAALSTDSLSADDMALLNRAGCAFSRVWNGRYRATALELIAGFPSPFEFFLALGRAWEKTPANPDEVLRALYDFAKANSLTSPLLLELMIFDLLKLENRPLPDFLADVQQDEARIREMLPDYAKRFNVPPPIRRNARLARFSHDVVGDKSERPLWVLFLYLPERKYVVLDEL